MWLETLAVLGGIALLVWSADQFVTGAAALARNLGVSTLVIGLTVVGLGTSAPEILVATVASLQHNPALAIGNAICSNIANIGLILGMTALIVPLQVASSTLRREYPVVLGITLLAAALLWDQDLSRMDGIILLIGLVLITYWMIRIARQGSPNDPLKKELDAEIPTGISMRKALGLLSLGLLLLLLSSRALVWGASEIAAAFGVSDLIIGLTIVAIGTSLPELAASVAGALKGEADIAIGNVLGSNLYNLLAVLSLPGVIAPGAVSIDLLWRDLPIMIILTLAIFLMSHRWFSPRCRINRVEGGVLLLSFAGYQYWLYQSASAAF